MACCGSGKKRTITQQQVVQRSSKPKKSASVQRIQRTNNGQRKTVTVQRQRVVPRQKCQHCGFPTMAVNIAGRERIQCSNPNCRVIIK